MTHLHRRTFLKAGLGGIAASMLSPSAAAFRIPTTSNNRLIVFILRGGYDALSAVIPYQSLIYQALRPQTSYSESEVNLTKLAGSPYALHPSLSALVPLWNAGELACIHKVGIVNPTFSHFKEQDKMASTSDDDSNTASGWIGRWATYREPVWTNTSVIGVDSSFLVEFRSDPAPGQPPPHPPLLLDTLAGFQIPTNSNFAGDSVRRNDAHLAAEQGVRDFTQPDNPLHAKWNAANLGAHELADVLAAIDAYDTSSYPDDTPLDLNVQQIAKLIFGGPGQGVTPNVYVALTGGFDTHEDQKAVLGGRWAEVNGALAPLIADLKHPTHTGEWGRTTILLISEFGRRNYDNASGGTDHGSATTFLMMGGCVDGGHHGELTNDSDLGQDVLPVMTDYRLVFGEILSTFMGVPLFEVQSTILPEMPSSAFLGLYRCFG